MRLEHLLSGAPEKKGRREKTTSRKPPELRGDAEVYPVRENRRKISGTSDKTKVIAFCNESPTKTLFNETHYRKDITQKSREGAEEWTVL